MGAIRIPGILALLAKALLVRKILQAVMASGLDKPFTKSLS